MEAEGFVRVLGYGAMVFAGLLLAGPTAQVFRGKQAWGAVLGLWISGGGFLLIGVGLAFAASGAAPAVLPGIILTAVGQFVQQRAAKKGSR